MKGHKADHHKARSTGGVNAAEEDVAMKPQRYNASRVEDEAEAKKRGGRAKRKVGGHVGEHQDVKGYAPKMNAGRKPRKNGGRTGSDTNPFTSARHGTAPPGRKLEMN